MYTLTYHEAVPDDIAHIPRSIRRRIQIAIESKLSEHPELFGKPLRHSLLGFRRLRVGDYRVVYLIRDTTVYIVIIAHRKHVYDLATTRTHA